MKKADLKVKYNELKKKNEEANLNSQASPSRHETSIIPTYETQRDFYKNQSNQKGQQKVVAAGRSISPANFRQTNPHRNQGSSQARPKLQTDISMRARREKLFKQGLNTSFNLNVRQGRAYSKNFNKQLELTGKNEDNMGTCMQYLDTFHDAKKEVALKV